MIQGLSPDHRCAAPDHVGFGPSDKPYDWSYRPEDRARNLGTLIDHLGLRGITLVVQDWGGPLGRFLIKRFNFFVNGVMKMATGGKSKLSRAIHQHHVQPLANPADGKGCWVLCPRRSSLPDRRQLPQMITYLACRGDSRAALAQTVSGACEPGREATRNGFLASLAIQEDPCIAPCSLLALTTQYRRAEPQQD